MANFKFYAPSKISTEGIQAGGRAMVEGAKAHGAGLAAQGQAIGQGFAAIGEGIGASIANRAEALKQETLEADMNAFVDLAATTPTVKTKMRPIDQITDPELNRLGIMIQDPVELNDAIVGLMMEKGIDQESAGEFAQQIMRYEEVEFHNPEEANRLAVMAAELGARGVPTGALNIVMNNRGITGYPSMRDAQEATNKAADESLAAFFESHGVAMKVRAEEIEADAGVTRALNAAAESRGALKEILHEPPPSQQLTLATPGSPAQFGLPAPGEVVRKKVGLEEFSLAGERPQVLEGTLQRPSVKGLGVEPLRDAFNQKHEAQFVGSDKYQEAVSVLMTGGSTEAAAKEMLTRQNVFIDRNDPAFTKRLDQLQEQALINTPRPSVMEGDPRTAATPSQRSAASNLHQSIKDESPDGPSRSMIVASSLVGDDVINQLRLDKTVTIDKEALDQAVIRVSDTGQVFLESKNTTHTEDITKLNDLLNKHLNSTAFKRRLAVAMNTQVAPSKSDIQSLFLVYGNDPGGIMSRLFGGRTGAQPGAQPGASNNNGTNSSGKEDRKGAPKEDPYGSGSIGQLPVFK